VAINQQLPSSGNVVISTEAAAGLGAEKALARRESTPERKRVLDSAAAPLRSK
jgi:hypothetical protein